MNILLTILFCVTVGSIAAVFWPRRNSREARTFLAATMFTAAIIALVNAWRRSAKR
ncbi:MAG: hypothetical protein ABSG79_03805 [Bryobacteraceae bacterium]|jgi:hypothetical protein